MEHKLDQSSRRCNIDIVLSDDGTFESSEDIHKQSGLVKTPTEIERRSLYFKK